MSSGTDLRAGCEQKGKKSHYGADQKGGENIVLHSWDHDDGYCYLYKNNSSDLTLTEDLEFTMTNLQLVGYTGTKLSIIIPPKQKYFLSVKRVNDKIGTKIAIRKSYAVRPSQDGDCLWVTIPDKEDNTNPALRQKTEDEGQLLDYADEHPNGAGIRRYKYQFPEGYCYLFLNGSEDMTLDNTMTFELTNLAIVDHNTNVLNLTLTPKTEKFFVIKEISHIDPFKLSFASSWTIRPYTPKDKQGGVTDDEKIVAVEDERVLKARCEKEGTLKDYGKEDPLAKGIYRYNLEYNEGYCLLFKNTHPSTTLSVSKLEFGLDNLQIKGKEEENILSFDVAPGNEEMIVINRKDAAKDFGISLKCAYTLK